MLRTLQKWWYYFAGNPQIFPMENRIFNAISALSTLILLALSAGNFLMGFGVNGIWTSATGIICSYLFYLARFKNKFTISCLTFAILSYVLLGVNYLVNSGIAGPTVYGFFLTFVLLIIISPRRQRRVWLISHLLVVPGLYIFEAFYPDMIMYQYDSVQLQIMDLSTTYIPVILALYVVANIVGRSYNFEKLQAQNAARELEVRNKQLEFSNREKDRLFSIIGHDLRGPLSTIHSYLEMLANFQLEEDERVQLNAELLGITHNTTNLLNNLLNWSARSRDQPPQMRPIRLLPHLEEVRDLMKAEAKRKKINLRLDLPGEDLAVLAESEMLYLVVRNLVNNALKFTEEEGHITISASKNGYYTGISVKDSGIGIPEEKQAKIFDSRIKSSPGTQSESGIGLGLVLCHEFVKAMGGTIKFESEENVGTEFMVHLKSAN